MRISLRSTIPAGWTHKERLRIANELSSMILKEHGDKIAAVIVFGSASVDTDGPYSDLDLTAITRVDIGNQSKTYTYDNLTINLDYQTIEESLQEASEPHSGGCWVDCLALYDPDHIAIQCRNVFQQLGVASCVSEFQKKMRDTLPTYIGKIRNAVIAHDRASFLDALPSFAREMCRALCIINGNHSVTGLSRLIEETKKLENIPNHFAALIDRVTGAVPASDQEMYDSAEDLWEAMILISAEIGVDWQTNELVP